MKTKRFVSTLLALLLVCSLPVSAFAMDDNPVGGQVSVPTGETMGTNYGTVTDNNGTVTENYGTVTDNGTEYDKTGTVETNYNSVVTNYGTVTTNNGTVTTNNDTGKVTTNNGKVTTNNGTVSTNNGTVTDNYKTVTDNYGTVTTNGSEATKYDAEVNNNYGTVTTNNGTVINNGTQDDHANAIVETNNFSVNSNYGVVSTNKDLVDNNFGTVTNNCYEILHNYKGAEVTNNKEGAVVYSNYGTVNDNKGTVVTNFGGNVKTNNGTVNCNDNGGAVETNKGTVIDNNGTVDTNEITGTVTNYRGTVGTNYGTVHEADGTTHYGVQVDNDGTPALEQKKAGEALDLTKFFAKAGYVLTGFIQNYGMENGKVTLLDSPTTVSGTSYTADCPNVLTLIWQAIVNPAAGETAAATDDGTGSFGPGSVISINGHKFLLVAVVEDVYCLASIDSYEEEQLSDLPALLSTLLTEEQLSHVTGDPELLDEALTACFFAGEGSHIVFPCDSSLIFS
ncbi:MAG: hypothetical protein ACI4P4_18470 [Faecousia sp.]